jgi:hypothetical protein
MGLSWGPLSYTPTRGNAYKPVRLDTHTNTNKHIYAYLDYVDIYQFPYFTVLRSQSPSGIALEFTGSGIRQYRIRWRYETFILYQPLDTGEAQ